MLRLPDFVTVGTWRW